MFIIEVFEWFFLLCLVLGVEFIVVEIILNSMVYNSDLEKYLIEFFWLLVF